MSDGDVINLVRGQLDCYLKKIEDSLQADALSYFGPIVFGADAVLRNAIEAFKEHKPRLVVVLDTPGGVVEVVERMVDTMRHFYGEVVFIVPDRAMSAGTILALSGDSIMMDYYSLLGPIDPQLEKDNKLVPALGYLAQYERMIERSKEGKLTTAEIALLQKLDLGELQQFEEARALSVDLLKKWLVVYKFKDWKTSNSTGKAVDAEYKTQRAEEIATALSEPGRWHSHARGIPMDVLRNDLRLKIDDLEGQEVHRSIRDYFGVASDYISKQGIHLFLHTRCFYLP
jgi:Serine dehydrogenase proteinase